MPTLTEPEQPPVIEGPLTAVESTDVRVMRAILAASESLSAAVLAHEFLTLTERRAAK